MTIACSSSSDGGSSSTEDNPITAPTRSPTSGGEDASASAITIGPGGGTSSSGGADDQNPGAPNAANTPNNGTPKNNVNVIECGGVTCQGDTELCCVGDLGQTKTCTAKGAACVGATVECGGRDNCGAGEVCCLRIGELKAACSAEGACGGQNQFVFCRTDADCPNGKVCVGTNGSFEEHKACF